MQYLKIMLEKLLTKPILDGDTTIQLREYIIDYSFSIKERILKQNIMNLILF